MSKIKKIKKYMCCCFTCVEILEDDVDGMDDMNDGSSVSSEDDLHASLLKNERSPFPDYQDIMNVTTNRKRNDVISTYQREKHKIVKNRGVIRGNGYNSYGNGNSNIYNGYGNGNGYANSYDDVDDSFMYTNKYFAPGRTLEQLKEEQKRFNVKYFLNRDMRYYKSYRQPIVQSTRYQRKLTNTIIQPNPMIVNSQPKFKKLFNPVKPRRIQREDSFGRPIFDPHQYMKQNGV